MDDIQLQLHNILVEKTVLNVVGKSTQGSVELSKNRNQNYGNIINLLLT